MTQEILHLEDKDKDIIPLSERNTFQRLLIKTMLGEDFLKKTRAEKVMLEIDWADKNATKVSDLIDNPYNKNIRNLIMQGNNEEAVDIVIELLKEDN